MSLFPRITAACALALALSHPASAQVLVMTPSPMDGAQDGTPSTGTGIANVVLDQSTNTMTWHVAYSGLTGPTTAAHFHGPAPAGISAGVQVDIGTANPSTGSAALSAQQAADLLSGLWYVNIHTAMFPGGEIRGQINPLEAKVVLNEVFYDGTGGDDGQTFVELAGPAGVDLTGWAVVSVEAGAAGSCGQVNTNGTTVLSGSIQSDGLFVLVDGLGTSGTTLVVVDPAHNGGMHDQLGNNVDYENGTDAVQLKHPTGLVVDAMTYGDLACGTLDVNGAPMVEGTFAFDVFAGSSLERWPQGADTDNNAVDFTAQCDPSAGASREPRSLFFIGNTTISGAAGGAVDLNMHTARPGAGYVMFAFATVPTSKVTLQLPFDPLSQLFILLATTPNPAVVNFVGTLDATGQGTASLLIPVSTAIPSSVTLSFAGATLPIGPNSIATNSVQVTLNP